MRLWTVLLAALLLPLLPAVAPAQGPAPQGTAPAGAPGAAAAGAAQEDPVVARVDGEPLRLSDVVGAAGDALPPELRTIPAAALVAMLPPDAVRQLTERAITERALLNAARRAGLDRDEEVRRRIRRAEEQELQQALLSREVGAAVTEDAVRARYEQETARRRSEEEVHARHVLVPTETEARQVLAEVQRPGADFAEVAKRRSTGPGAQEGGDLGFFKRSDMIPEFAEAAFALQPGQVGPAPVRTTFGWHVIKVEGRRAAPVPAFEEVGQSLRQRMMEEQVDGVVRRIRAAAAIERLDGTPPARSLMDGAAPPPPPVAPQPRGTAPPPPPPQRR
jgi:peptidyl-prolyl cis-trans isomerase C